EPEQEAEPRQQTCRHPAHPALLCLDPVSFAPSCAHAAHSISGARLGPNRGPRAGRPCRGAPAALLPSSSVASPCDAGGAAGTGATAATGGGAVAAAAVAAGDPSAGRGGS